MKTTVVKVKDRLWVHENGRIYSLPWQKKMARSAQDEAEAQDLAAPFTCKVLRVLVKEGQNVKKGDGVVAVEAMKMEYAYTSPRDGVVARVLVEPGKIVQEGSAFVEWKK
ncbi:MAG: biotin/lipoyl-binding protein [Bdellovibrionales bacterium]|nr:biotin/lipoyl-binding protein [Bdellovibrionales bacterium]